MGYYMTQQAAKFCIKKKKFAAALAAIKELANQPKRMGGGSSMGEKWFSWVSTAKFVNATTLPLAMSAWRWEVDCSEKTGDIVNLTFCGEKLGDDEILFKTLAPFVVKGSYIEMEGEDGHHWKWKFDGETMTEVSGKVVYENE